jgi:hypothetical protein
LKHSSQKPATEALFCRFLQFQVFESPKVRREIGYITLMILVVALLMEVIAARLRKHYQPDAL